MQKQWRLNAIEAGLLLISSWLGLGTFCRSGAKGKDAHLFNTILFNSRYTQCLKVTVYLVTMLSCCSNTASLLRSISVTVLCFFSVLCVIMCSLGICLTWTECFGLDKELTNYKLQTWAAGDRIYVRQGEYGMDLESVSGIHGDPVSVSRYRHRIPMDPDYFLNFTGLSCPRIHLW